MRNVLPKRQLLKRCSKLVEKKKVFIISKGDLFKLNIPFVVVCKYRCSASNKILMVIYADSAGNLPLGPRKGLPPILSSRTKECFAGKRSSFIN